MTGGGRRSKRDNFRPAVFDCDLHVLIGIFLLLQALEGWFDLDKESSALTEGSFIWFMSAHASPQELEEFTVTYRDYRDGRDSSVLHDQNL